MEKEVGNVGSSCINGYFILNDGSGKCTKVNDYYFHHINSDGIVISSPSIHIIVDNNTVIDSGVGAYVYSVGPNAARQSFNKEKDRVTIVYCKGFFRANDKNF